MSYTRANPLTLEAGKRLGPYEIVTSLGAGGMGEVYKARDTRLDRTVAIKVLPAHLSESPDRRQRFEREAKAISALSHPHICVLHDIGHQDGIPFLVMEHLEGETLADRLARGALPLDQALRYGIEIAEALEKAHRHGIVHRDLKPGNVMLTKSGAKLLDFGLAKLKPAGPQTPAASQLTGLPTEEKPLTAEGSIIGTFQYMAPEQLEGKEPDARTDIFALGAVLFEMVTGQRAFTGKSQASLIAAILTSDPAPMSRLQPVTPASLDRVVAACLAKDPDERCQNAQDLARELRWIAEAGLQDGLPAPAMARRTSRERLAWTAAGIGLLLGIGGLGFAIAQRGHVPPEPLQARFQIGPPDNAVFFASSMPVLSPDGAHIALPAFDENRFRLYVRPLSSLVATPVVGGEGGAPPFWSADGRRLGFLTRGKLMSLDVSGGSPQTICDCGGTFFSGATWNHDGVIVFSDSERLYRVEASGGQPEPLGKADGETGRFWPHFLPDGRRYLYLARTLRPEDQGIYVASLDSAERKFVVRSNHNAAHSATGHLLYVRGGDALTAQAFDLKRLELSGEPLALSQPVMLTAANFPGAAYSVSGKVLALRKGSAIETQLTWFDRSGKKLGMVGEPAGYSNPALAPHEQSLAVGRIDPATRTRDLWVFDLVRGARTRLTFDPADETNATWSPDGTRIAFSSDRGGLREVYEKPANGSGAEELLVSSKDGSRNVEDWSSDGRFLLFNHGGAERPADLHLLALTGGERKPVVFLAAPQFGEQMGQFAPATQWIAYASNESAQNEVYVQSFSAQGAGRGKWQVSTAGGIEPRWRRDGKELFYLSGSTLMAVSVKTDGISFEPGLPQRLFEVRLGPPGRNRYVATRDGQRFLFNTSSSDTSGTAPIEVIMNWLPPKR